RHQDNVVGERGGVDEALDIRQGAAVEAGDALGVGVGERGELVVGDRAVDIAVALRQLAVEVLAAEDDLKGPAASHDAWQAGRGSAAGNRREPDLELPEYGALAAGEADVGRQGKLAAGSPGTAADGADRDS